MPAYLQAGDRQVNLSEPVCMGVINLTPDSFSDGALLANATASDFCVDLDKALDHAEAMVEAGAAILDIGGESTRPGAAEVSESEELERVLPLVEAVASRLDVCISVDTSSPSVMSQAIAAGAHLINDVRALSCKGAVEVVAQSSAAACLMHMRGSPATMQDNTEYDDVVAEVYAFLASRLNECIDNGISSCLNNCLVCRSWGYRYWWVSPVSP